MQIENQKQRTSRFNKNAKKKRSIFGLDDDDTDVPNSNQIKLFGQEHDPNSTTIITPIVLQQPAPSIIRQHTKQIQDKLSATYSKYVKNQMYYGQFNSNQGNDYQRKYESNRQIGTREDQNEERNDQIDNVKSVKKERRLKRKNRKSISKFQEIVLEQQIDQSKEKQDIDCGQKQKKIISKKLISENNQNESKVKQTKQVKQIKQMELGDNLKLKTQNTSQNAQKGSLYSPNHNKYQKSKKSISPKKKRKQEQDEQSDSDKSMAIGSFSALLGANDQIISLKPMMYNALPVNSTMRCYIKRTSSFNLTLLIYLDDHKFLMKSQSQNASIGCNYYISLSTEVNKNDQTYLGKLRSDFIGSVYTLYDCGVSEKQKKQNKSKSEGRSILANIEYQNNLLGIKGPRRIKVRIPNPTIKDKSIFRLKDKQTLANVKQTQDIINPSVLILNNKKPVWNQKIKTYALNFGGRVKMPSIKNFILQNNEQKTIMTFGKIDNNTFSLQFRHPLSPFQAFGIAMSSFDFKLNCQ